MQPLWSLEFLRFYLRSLIFLSFIIRVLLMIHGSVRILGLLWTSCGKCWNSSWRILHDIKGPGDQKRGKLFVAGRASKAPAAAPDVLQPLDLLTSPECII